MTWCCQWVPCKREKICAVNCFFWLCTVSSFLGAWRDVGGWLQGLVGQPVPWQWQLVQYILECSTRSTTEPKACFQLCSCYKNSTQLFSFGCQTGYQYIPDDIWNGVAWTLYKGNRSTSYIVYNTKEHMRARQTQDQYILDGRSDERR